GAAALPASLTVAELRGSLHAEDAGHGQRLYPVVDADRRLVGVVTRKHLSALVRQPPRAVTSAAVTPARLGELATARPVVAHPDESLRVVVYRMAETGLTRLPVVEPGTGELRGMIALFDLLKARALNLEAERRRERVSPMRLFF